MLSKHTIKQNNPEQNTQLNIQQQRKKVDNEVLINTEQNIIKKTPQTKVINNRHQNTAVIIHYHAKVKQQRWKGSVTHQNVVPVLHDEELRLIKDQDLNGRQEVVISVFVTAK